MGRGSALSLPQEDSADGGGAVADLAPGPPRRQCQGRGRTSITVMPAAVAAVMPSSVSSWARQVPGRRRELPTRTPADPG
ncbi:hypothetical protein C7C46_14375 [Streptomyces tateyamensis]|uniref:Uncharacterized protein n=1 Tax=Streptomyces tateyamensis TaxID=565073 RepID=A0A2V4NTC3_9ACTN|nr:hypothetical protein C7C46_14375 [Streptomyces tateyamensis]